MTPSHSATTDQTYLTSMMKRSQSGFIAVNLAAVFSTIVLISPDSWAQDSRQVTEPRLPRVCTVLTATYSSAEATATEEVKVETAKIQKLNMMIDHALYR